MNEAGTYLFVDVTIDAQAAPGPRSIAIRTAAGQAAIPLEILAPLPREGRFQGLSPDDAVYLLMPDRFLQPAPLAAMIRPDHAIVTLIGMGAWAVAGQAANGIGGEFEIDSDANLVVDGGSPAIDWLAGGSGSAVRSGVITKNDKPTGSGDDSFGQGSKEDTAVPTVVDGSIPPNKSDLTRFYVANQRVAGKEFLYLAWERVQEPQGTTNMDFEFNQSSTISGNGVTPVRTPGDVLIKYDLSRGGTVPTLGYHLWTDTGPCEAANSAPCWGPVQSLAGNFEGSINAVSVSDPIPPNEPRTLSPRTFGEAAINLQASGIFEPGVCRLFGRAYVKSRSSDSFVAELKDFIAPIPINITNCAPVTLNNRAWAEADNFAPSGGNLGEPGSVAYLFDKKGLVVVDSERYSEDDLMVAIDAGAEDIGADDDMFEITCEPSDLAAVRAALDEAGIEVESAEVAQLPKTRVALDEEGKPRPVPGVLAQGQTQRRRQKEAKIRRRTRLAHKQAIQEHRDTAEAEQVEAPPDEAEPREDEGFRRRGHLRM